MRKCDSVYSLLAYCVKMRKVLILNTSWENMLSKVVHHIKYISPLTYHWVESIQIRRFSGPYFLVFGLNGALRSKSPYSVWIQENTDQKNSEFGHFSRSVLLKVYFGFSTHSRSTFHFYPPENVRKPDILSDVFRRYENETSLEKG